MSIGLQSIAELDPDEVAQSQATLTSIVNADDPTLDLRPGPFYSLLIYYGAALMTLLQQNITDYLNARSLAVLNADPTLATDALVDDVLSNYNITRLPGALATGSVVIALTTNTSVTIGVGTIFQANGLQFTADQTFTAQPNPGLLLTAGDVLITPTADGNFAFTIQVTALDVGANYNLPKNTVIVPVVAPNNYITSYVASDFMGGTFAETSAQLLSHLQTGIATKNMSSRTTMFATLLNVPAFNGLVNSSVIGMGDTEMIRDKHSIFPIAMGGRADWYLRTQVPLLNLAITKSATLISVGDDGYGIWQFALTRDDAPGFYEITDIVISGTDPTTSIGGFNLVSDTRAMDFTNLEFVPDIISVTEGMYSRYQTSVIQFKDTITSALNLAIGVQQNYDLAARCMPLIGDIQDYISARDTRNFGSDILVKAPIPCFVTIVFRIFLQSGAVAPDADAIANSVVGVINNTAFIGRLYASQLADAIFPYLVGTASISSIDMLGRILAPDGSIQWIRSREVLTVPNGGANMVSPRTVQFFADPTDIGISIITAIPSE